jgi:hypothetical protein
MGNTCNDKSERYTETRDDRIQGGTQGKRRIEESVGVDEAREGGDGDDETEGDRTGEDESKTKGRRYPRYTTPAFGR